jgi:hypothetical protein
MKKSILISFVAGIFLIYLNSCAPLYIPNVVNAPMLSEKNDLNAAINFGLSGTDVQTAYAITDNIGIMVNGSFMNETSDTINDNYHKHIFVEAGAGYYKTFGKFIQFETYGGYGIGRINSYQTSGEFSSFADTYVNRFFVQPAIGFKSNYFELAFAPRTICAFVSQENVSKTGLFIEPTLLLKAGSPMVKVVAQFGLSYMLNDYSNSFNYEPFLFSFGLQFSLRSRESDKKF